VRNCTRDEGGPFEVGNQVLISSRQKLLSSKAMVVNVAEKSGLIPAGKVERGERKRTADEVSKADWRWPFWRGETGAAWEFSANRHVAIPYTCVFLIKGGPTFDISGRQVRRAKWSQKNASAAEK
jgi:hypothetical protein